ncbi:MAG: oxidase [Gemmataceae bacterium]
MAEEHRHPNYLAVFGFLVIFTAVSFWTVSRFWPLSHDAGHTLVMLVAVVKAVLVAMFFMHLVFDWFKVYYMIVPALVFGIVVMCALLPDMTFSPTREVPFADMVAGRGIVP